MQLNTLFLNWLHQRKITDTVIKQFGLRVENDKLVIPVLGSDGTFLFNKYRKSPLVDDASPKYTYDKGGKLSLYGADKLQLFPTVLWTEGELDALVAWSHNIPAVSGTGGAMSIAIEWGPILYDKEVIICFDNDHAGGEGMVRALELVPTARILFLPDKPGVKDISDYVAHGGNLNELIKTAQHFSGLPDVIADRAERVSQWQSTHFHDAYIKRMAEREVVHARKTERIKTDDRVLRAKNYPIDTLLTFNGRGKASCPFHSESTASLHLYRDQNRAWCFGSCGRGYDSIDIYQKIHNCSFKEAVEALQ